MPPRIELYIDANVLLDYIERRRSNQNSIEVIDRIKSDSDLIGVFSTFSIMEAVDQIQEMQYGQALFNLGHTLSEIRELARRRRLSPDECRRCYERVYNTLKGLGSRFEIKAPSDPAVWTLAAKLMRETNLSAPDAIHVSVAIAMGCDGFVTGDTFLVDQIRQHRYSATRLVPVQTLKAKADESFRRDLERGLRTMGGRRRKRKRSNIPHELRALVGVVTGGISDDRDVKTAIKRYEKRLRKTN